MEDSRSVVQATDRYFQPWIRIRAMMMQVSDVTARRSAEAIQTRAEPRVEVALSSIGADCIL